MKTPLLIIAALVALFTLPVDFTVLCSVLFAAGLVAILMFDYGRTHRPVTATVLAAEPAEIRERFRLAA